MQEFTDALKKGFLLWRLQQSVAKIMVLRKEKLPALQVKGFRDRLITPFFIIVAKCPEIVPVCVPFFLGKGSQITKLLPLFEKVGRRGDTYRGRQNIQGGEYRKLLLFRHGMR